MLSGPPLRPSIAAAPSLLFAGPRICPASIALGRGWTRARAFRSQISETMYRTTRNCATVALGDLIDTTPSSDISRLCSYLRRPRLVRFYGAQTYNSILAPSDGVWGSLPHGRSARNGHSNLRAEALQNYPPRLRDRLVSSSAVHQGVFSLTTNGIQSCFPLNLRLDSTLTRARIEQRCTDTQGLKLMQSLTA